jgi:RHS repeat-associated protein
MSRVMMSSIAGSQILGAYTYNPMNHRVMQNNGVITRYLWDSQSMYGDVVLEMDSVGTPQVNYVLGATQLLAQVRGSDISYFLPDVQGSTRLLTDVAGNVTDTYSYDAFGDLSAQSGTTENSYLYTGQQFDEATGLYSLRARYYNPTVGRFISRDTWVLDSILVFM